MGQRSQIYIRYNVNGKRGENYKGLIARYYGWNYGERMISRARYIIENLQEEYLKYKFPFGDEGYLEKLRRICDANFDIKDIVMSSDIIKEVRDYFNEDCNEIFNQDNNNGQLFIDVTDDGIKYCFMEYFDEGSPMTAEEYMKWDCETESHTNWHVPYEYRDAETINYTEENIEQIGKLATVMSMEELENFINDDYSYLFSPLQSER